MAHNTAGQFEALLSDLAIVQNLRDQGALPQHGGEMRKALPAQSRRPATPQGCVPFSYFEKAMRASRPVPTMATTMAELGALQRRTSSLKNDANAQLQMAVGERRARLRDGAQSILERAMRGLAQGTVTAIEVAHIEAACARVLAGSEPGPTMRRAGA